MIEQHIQFTVDSCPVAQPRARHSAHGGRAITYGAPKSHPIHDFKYAVRQRALAEMDLRSPLEGPLLLSIDFYLPRPAKHDAMTGRGASKQAKYPDGPIPHTGKPDLDNLIKAVKDALKGVTWKDDSQVFRYGMMGKYHHAKGGRPYVFVHIRTIEETQP